MISLVIFDHLFQSFLCNVEPVLMKLHEKLVKGFYRYRFLGFFVLCLDFCFFACRSRVDNCVDNEFLLFEIFEKFGCCELPFNRNLGMMFFVVFEIKIIKEKN